MPNALTLEIMSPGLLKVGGTRNPEPHWRKSRMREIRSSGSGEGPGWATSRPTLQRPLPPPASPLPPAAHPPLASPHPAAGGRRPAGGTEAWGQAAGAAGAAKRDEREYL